MAYANPFQPPGPPPPGMSPDDLNFYYQNVPAAGWWKQLFDWQPETGEYWGMGNKAHYAQNQFSRYQDVFNVAAARDPNLQWYDWLKQQKDPGAEYETLGPDARGESGFRSYTPRARWNMGGY